MKIEHVAFNVSDPASMAEWYTENLGFSIVKQIQNAPFMTFLADNSGKMMIEIYNNPAAEVPDYREMHPLILHLAFVSENPPDDRQRLVDAGATVISDEILNDGSHLIMLRDPWGICIQLCKRAISLLR
jgi:catechol 2,3-dioxygenase-like lactoylglutathione lyase family enzyme